MQKSNFITISASSISHFATLAQVQPSIKELYVRSLTSDISAILEQPRLAIVGSRKVSSYGQAVTKKLAYDLAREGITIVSGLALGVDSIGHRGAVEAGGQTIAILPCGIDTIYPRSHVGLARSILSSNPRSALISEYAGNIVPMRHQFLERNRIIAAISDAVLITEAAIRSGSLSTANHALELGIPVMAVPGPIDSPTSQGTNNLIKAGAHLVSNVQDILAVMDIDSPSTKKQNYLPQDEIETQIINLIGSGQRTTSDIIKNSDFTSNQINQCLTMLEIKGIIRNNDYLTWHLL